MKKILLITCFAVALTIISFASCKKAQVCATCIEKKTQTKAQDYCGTSAEVDTYISELKRTGGNLGQSWECSKH